jgi:hypothetical protein
VDLVDTRGRGRHPGRRRPFSPPEDQAEVTVSSAHEVNGREWVQVEIADGFTPPSDGLPDDSGRGTACRIDGNEAYLAYVAVTCTWCRLDIGVLPLDQRASEKEHRPVPGRRSDPRDGFWGAAVVSVTGCRCRLCR